MARLIDPFEQIEDSSGHPVVDGLMYFYDSGSSTVKKDTFADIAETVANSNPVVLDGDGRAPNVFGTGSYRVVITNKAGVQVGDPRDPVGGDEDAGFGSDWISTQIYDATDVVRDAGSYWQSITGDNIGNKPSLDGGVNWTQISFMAGGGTVLYFDTIADMVISTELSIGDVVQTLGSVAKYDGGWNIYEIVAAGTGTDNLGKWIDLATHQAVGAFPDGYNIKQFQAADGAESTANIQAAVDYVQSLNTGGGHGLQFTPKLTAPAGRYIVTAPITTDATKEIHLEGAGMASTIFDCSTGGAFSEFIDTSLTGSEYNYFSDFAIYGNGQLTYGLRLRNDTETVIERVRFSGATSSGLLLSDGTASINDCHFVSNGAAAAGADVSGTFASINFSGCVFSSQAWGLIASNCSVLNIIGCEFISNTKMAIFMARCISTFVSAYFETNAGTGHTFTGTGDGGVPNITVKSDVVISGIGSLIAVEPVGANDSVNVTFQGCYSTVDTTTPESIIHSIGHSSLSIDGFTVEDSASSGLSLIKTSARPLLTMAEDISVKGFNSTDGNTSLFDVTNLGNFNTTWPHTCNAPVIPSIEATAKYGSDPTTWSSLVAGTSTLTITLHTADRNAVDTYKSAQDIGGDSNTVGFTFALTDIEDYDATFWYAFLMVKAETGTPNFDVLVDNGDTTFSQTGSGTATTSSWAIRCIPFQMNGTGTARIAVKHFGGSASDAAIWTRPIVAPLGAAAWRFGVVE